MKVIEITLCIFAVLGIIDAITGNHLKIGEEFKKGISAIGSLVFCMMGFIILSPVIADFLVPVLQPVADTLGIDVSIIAGFFSSDGGGGVMAFELTDNELWAGYNGLVVGSLFGWMICMIPMALNLTEKKYYDDVLNGLLCGIATLPIGCILGGILLGTPIVKLLITNIPVILVSILTCIGLIFNPQICRKIFKIIGMLLNIVLFVGLGIGFIQRFTNIVIFENIVPIDDAFGTVCYIAMLLAGIFPLLNLFSRIFKKPLVAFGKLLKIDEFSVVGLITTLANCIPTFAFSDKMNKKGRLMNYAFATSAAFVFGDHMAFILAFSSEKNLDGKYLIAVIISKLVGGFAAIILTQLLFKKLTKSDNEAVESENIITENVENENIATAESI